MKLDETAIDKMIVEVLSERVKFPYSVNEPKDFPHYTGSSQPAMLAINALKDITSPEEVLDNNDIQHLINNTDDVEIEHVQAARYLIKSFKDGLRAGKFSTRSEIKNATTAIEVLSQIEMVYDQKVQAAQVPDSTITAPEFSTRRAETGDFPATQKAIVQRAMADTGNIYSRVKALSKISREYYKASVGEKDKLSNKAASEILNDIMLLDTFNYVIKDMDAGTGGYLFEYLLAMLVEGRVTGKETTDEGKMGATDFISADGVRGSSKYYSTPSNIGQAVGGFNVNEPVKYIVGIKKEDIGDTGKQQTTKGGKSDPARIVAVDLFYFSVNMDSDGKFKAGRRELKVKKDGKKKKVILDSAIDKGSYAGTIYLASVATSNFAEMMDNAITTTQQGVQEAYNAMKNMFAEMQTVKQSTKMYISSGDVAKGNDAFNSLKKTEDNFSTVVRKLASEEGYGQVDQATSKIVQEDKLQSLDQLIAETLRDIKKSIK
jgi:hypothetical protein